MEFPSVGFDGSYSSDSVVQQLESLVSEMSSPAPETVYQRRKQELNEQQRQDDEKPENYFEADEVGHEYQIGERDDRH